MTNEDDKVSTKRPEDIVSNMTDEKRESFRTRIEAVKDRLNKFEKAQASELGVFTPAEDVSLSGSEGEPDQELRLPESAVSAIFDRAMKVVFAENVFDKSFRVLAAENILDVMRSDRRLLNDCKIGCEDVKES